MKPIEPYLIRFTWSWVATIKWSKSLDEFHGLPLCKMTCATVTKYTLIKIFNLITFWLTSNHVSLLSISIITIVGTTPERTRDNPTEHSSMGHVACQLSVWIPLEGHATFLNLSSRWPHSLIRTSCPDPVLAS